MRTRAPHHRVLELQNWLKKNKKASWQEFVKHTGGTKSQYYHARENIGLGKNSALSEAMKKVYAAKKSKSLPQSGLNKDEAVIAARNKDNEEFLAGPSKDRVVVEGVTPDFIWYEMDLMQRKMSDISQRLNHVMKVSQSRDHDQKKMMRDLISENSQLRVDNNALRQQVSELTEMINGTPV